MHDRASVNRFHVRVRMIGMVGLLVVSMMGCASMGPPAPEVGYRADVRVEIRDASLGATQVSNLVEYAYKGKRAKETRVDGSDVVLIDRPDLRVSWRLNPAERTFEEYRISSPNAVLTSVPDPFGPRADASFELLGTESVDGVESEKYAVTGERIAGFAWVYDDGIPLRFEGAIGQADSEVEIEIEYSQIRRGPQAAYRFAIPQNYAGYDERKKKKKNRTMSSEEADSARRGLESEMQGRQHPYGAVQPPPPPPPPTY